MARRAEGAAIASPYGDIFPTARRDDWPAAAEVPAGFRYQSYSWTGDVMADDVRCPNLHDGMAVVDAQGNSGRIILVRNHEGGAGTPVPEQAVDHVPQRRGRRDDEPDLQSAQGRWEKDWSSLAGTNRNCAGGVTPWGTWITGEETDATPAMAGRSTSARRKAIPTPLKAMGRFSHEAMMVDPDTGYVYETEDATPSGFYRFIPNVPGELNEGGEL